jgi:hypothetical protein
VGLCSKVEVNHVHSVNRWSGVDDECFCVVKGFKGRLAGSFGTANFRVDCTLPLT